MAHIDGHYIKMAIGINLNDDNFISTGRKESYDSVGEREKVMLTDNKLELRDFQKKDHKIHIMDHHGSLVFTISYEALPVHLSTIAHLLTERLKEIIK